MFKYKLETEYSDNCNMIYIREGKDEFASREYVNWVVYIKIPF